MINENKNKKELLEQIKNMQEDLYQMRQAHAITPLNNSSLLRKKRKEIARAYTQFHQLS